MKIKNSLIFLATIGLGSSCCHAAVSADEAEKLGTELTPLGAVMAGNEAGTIPAWDGGITTPPTSYQPGMHHPDPFPDDQVLFTITAENMDQYDEYLTDGYKALLKTYPDSYKMPVYTTRRSASYPEFVYEYTKKNATTSQLTEGGNGISGAVIGIPFPMPETGLEVVWNHLCRYRGQSASRTITQAAPTRSGNYSLVEFYDEYLFNYSQLGKTPESLDNTLVYFKQTVVSPARLAGSILLVHETLDQIKEPRRAWTYNVGQRRTRAAPNVAYDNPGTASDGMRTSDQLDMFNGAPNRYDWKLIGKKELYIPYNSYTLHSDKVKVDDIIKPLHINQDLARYELHRCWVVEATLKEGTRHIYAKRTFYVDEDSWQIMAADNYDGRGELWRISEAHSINYYDVPTFWATLEVHMDLFAGRYLAMGMDNELPMYDFGKDISEKDFTPASLRRQGIR